MICRSWSRTRARGVGVDDTTSVAGLSLRGKRPTAPCPRPERGYRGSMADCKRHRRWSLGHREAAAAARGRGARAGAGGRGAAAAAAARRRRERSRPPTDGGKASERDIRSFLVRPLSRARASLSPLWGGHGPAEMRRGRESQHQRPKSRRSCRPTKIETRGKPESGRAPRRDRSGSE